MFFIGLKILSNFTNKNSPLSCISMKNQAFKTRPQVINVNGDGPVLFPFIIHTSKCSGSCNNINYSYAKICISDIIRNINVKVFNLMSRTNETRFIEWQELIDKGVCDKGFIWNPSKTCDVGEYLDYENWKCRKVLVDKLVDECTEIIEEAKLAGITLAENENNHNVVLAKCIFN